MSRWHRTHRAPTLVSRLVAGGMLMLSAALSAGDGEITFLDGFEGTGNVPQFVPVDPQVAVAERALGLDIDTSDPASQAGLRFSLDAAPSGMSIQAASGVIGWTPSTAQVGPNPVTVRVEDLAGLANTLSFSIEVVDPNASPSIAPIDDQGVSVGALLALTVQASDPDSLDPPLLTLQQAPVGMTLDPISGQLEWLTGPGDVGIHPVRLRATDAGGRFGETLFTVTVAQNLPPVLLALPDRGATPGVPVSVQPIASDPNPGDVLRWSLPERPPGMGIDPDSGAIHWTPTSLQLGPHPVTVRVADALGEADQRSFQIAVDLNRAPVAVDDAGYRVERGDTLQVDAPGLLANDSDPNSDPLSALLVDGPARGTLSLNADGGFDYTPDNPSGSIGLVEKFSYLSQTGGNTWQPLLGNIDDDPQAEIIVLDTGAGAIPNRIVALDGASGAVEWIRTLEDRQLAVEAKPVLADLDLDGRAELIVIGGEPDFAPPEALKLYAFDAGGQLKWISEELPDFFFLEGDRRSNRELGRAALSVADLDQDGFPEILAAPDFGPAAVQVWDYRGRKLFQIYEPDTGPDATLGDAAPTRVAVVDLDLDGDLEIVVGNTAWSHDGTLLWKRVDGFRHAFNWESDFPLIANLDDDPFPELVRTRGGLLQSTRGNVVAWNHDGTTLWEVDRPFGFNSALISIADVDRDGYADILVPSEQDLDLFEVLDGRDGSVKWSKSVTTRTSGATVLDLDLDGFPEVVFIDESATVHVWDGRDGSDKGSFPTGQPRPAPFTLPAFADVDADGAAELVVAGGGVLGSGAVVSVWDSPGDDWPPMRPVWTQARHYVTNIEADLSVPRLQRPHWLLPGLNQYMVNERLPEDRIEDRDGFSYRASDGELQSNLAEVSIEILPPNTPPRILSTPPVLASPGFEYVYQVLAVDADPGELLQFEVGEGPAGMSVNGDGRVSWAPSVADLGNHPVVITVRDSLGVAGYQNFVIEVTDPVTVPDLGGLDEVAALAALEAITLRADPLRDVFSDLVAVGEVAAQSPPAGTSVAAGAGVTVEISRGPLPVTVPRLVGLALDDASAMVIAGGLVPDPVVWVNDPRTPSGTVLIQDPAPTSQVPPGSPVALTVSGGPRAVISIDPPLIPAGSSATVSATIYDVDGTPLDPQPAINLSLQVDPAGLFGTPPSLNGNSIQTGADSQGVFRVEASFSTRGAEVASNEVAVLPAISDGPGGTVYSEFTRQQADFLLLIEALIAAVDGGDAVAIASLDTALGELEQDIDLRRLRTLTAIAPDGGVAPTPAQAAAGGFNPAPDDGAYVDASLELVTLLDAIDRVVREGSAPDLILNQLNQELAAAASAVAGLEPSELGVLRAVPEITALLGTLSPRMLVADIQAVRQALREAGIITADGSVSAGRFTLPGIMVASQIRQSIISDFYVPYLGEAARMLGAVIAADLLQTYTNAGALVGIVTGGSIAIHVFQIPNSVIEGLGFDPRLSANNSVTMIGPDLFSAASDAASAVSSASSARDLNSAMDGIQDVLDGAGGLQEAWNDANSIPDSTGRGCILDNRPGCGQLVYPDGFTSVYNTDGGLSLPGPVLIIVRNLENNASGVFVANFVPTQEDDE